MRSIDETFDDIVNRMCDAHKGASARSAGLSYRVVWDNGASACGMFSYTFDTYDEADAFGKDWANESNLRDFGTLDPEEGYTYYVIREDCK